MFGTLRFNFDVNILVFFRLGNCFGYFLQYWVIFFKSSGHTDWQNKVSGVTLATFLGKWMKRKKM
jgi:hypothetical protein